MCVCICGGGEKITAKRLSSINFFFLQRTNICKMEKITFKAISKHVLPRWRPQRQPSEPSYFRQALQMIFFSSVLGGAGGDWRRAQFPAEDLTPFQLVKLPGLVPVPCSPLGAAEKQRGWVVETPALQPSRESSQLETSQKISLDLGPGS